MKQQSRVELSVGQAQSAIARSRVRRMGPETELDEQWRRGDSDAITRVHRRYRGRLEAVAYRILGNHADAEDVVQKIFMALRSTNFRGDSTLWTYLYRAAVNGSVNVLRSKRRQEAAEKRLLENQLLTPHSTVACAEAQVLEGEILAEVAKALLVVKPQHRRVLTLRIMHGLSNTEIAEHEGLPPATVGTWLRRGREELQRGLRPVMKELRRKKLS
jgi:RNA polymerase sigma-70 factor (ECF subfamily)